jgi:hypothetical protein
MAWIRYKVFNNRNSQHTTLWRVWYSKQNKEKGFYREKKKDKEDKKRKTL